MKKDFYTFHTRFDTHAILSAIFFTACSFLLPWLLTADIAHIFQLTNSVNLSLTVHTALSFGTLAAFKTWFHKDFEGSMVSRNFFFENRFFLIFAVYWIVHILINICEDNFVFNKPSFFYVMTAIDAGITEEIAFRAIPVSYLMKQWHSDEKKIPFTVILSSLIFGLSHSVNFITGSDASYVIMQIVGAFCTGSLFCAIYLKTGSIIPTMIIHSMHNILAFATDPNIDMNSIAIAGSLSLTKMETAYTVISYIAFTAIAFFLIRPSKRQEILSIWNRKWSIDYINC